LASNAADFDCRLSFDESKDVPFPQNESDPTAYGQIGARLTIAALEGALRRGTSAALGSRLPAQQGWAAKTGTSSERKDSWYVLLSPDVVLLGWVGRDDNKATRFTGATGALPLVSSWVRSMLNTSTQREATWSWPIPEGMEWKLIDDQSGCEVMTFVARAPESTTPPPEVFERFGRKVVWELFKSGSRVESCR
jgi:membrane peptidoglycan carboxypeptidase